MTTATATTSAAGSPAGTARDRAIGALVGLAVGDAVGTALEFRPPGTFEPIDDMVGGGPFGLAPGQWTDDTSMAMCLAESLLDTGGMHPDDQLRRYVGWMRRGYWSSIGRCFDIGNTTRQALERFERDGSVSDPEPDPGRAANGSLMRLAPVAIRWHADPAEAATRSAESSRTTHPAPRPVDCCRLLGAMLAALISGAPADHVLSPAFWRYGRLDPTVEAIARGSWLHKQPPAIAGTGYCVAALEAALWAVSGADGFRQAVLRAANLGDDADTTAAIAGQLAGARWGYQAIPAEWRGRISRHERIVAIAGHLHDDAVGAPAPAVWPDDDVCRAYWVEPGALLAGEHPGHTDTAVAAYRIDLLVDHGIRTFVDLTNPADGLPPYGSVMARAADWRRLDLRYVSHPIPDFGVLDAAGYDAIIATVRSASRRGGVYLHCRGGVGRTGTVVGCLLADSGMSADAALDRLAALRAHTATGHRASPETPAQVEVVRARAAGRLPPR